MKRVAVLGSTGSIGKNTLDVIAKHPDKFKVVALVAGSNADLLEKQTERFRPKYSLLRDRDGDTAICDAVIAPEVDIVVSAIVGAAGLRPTYAALKAGKRVALANKESLVAAGAVMTKIWKEGTGELIPVDSEHSAIHQVLHGTKKETKRILLTASGGPFRTFTPEALEKVTVAQALKHPNWSMGAKITVDSSTLMNKGLEIIEARWLFDMPPAKIDVIVHPQSVIHSMVEYIDGSVLAQMGNPDMRTPIAYALGFPERIATNVMPLDLATVRQLTFEPPDTRRFPCLALAKQALEMGGNAPAILNAANEVAVEAFLKERISFLRIPALIEKVLNGMKVAPLNSLENVIETDLEARERATELL